MSVTDVANFTVLGSYTFLTTLFFRSYVQVHKILSLLRIKRQSCSFIPMPQYIQTTETTTTSQLLGFFVPVFAQRFKFP